MLINRQTNKQAVNRTLSLARVRGHQPNIQSLTTAVGRRLSPGSPGGPGGPAAPGGPLDADMFAVIPGGPGGPITVLPGSPGAPCNRYVQFTAALSNILLKNRHNAATYRSGY